MGIILHLSFVIYFWAELGRASDLPVSLFRNLHLEDTRMG
jgi:hypothetical protein